MIEVTWLMLHICHWLIDYLRSPVVLAYVDSRWLQTAQADRMAMLWGLAPRMKWQHGESMYADWDGRLVRLFLNDFHTPIMYSVFWQPLTTKLVLVSSHTTRCKSLSWTSYNKCSIRQRVWQRLQEVWSRPDDTHPRRATLAYCSRSSHIQARLVYAPVSARHGSEIPHRLLHARLWRRRPATFTVCQSSAARRTTTPAHHTWPSGLHCYGSHGLELAARRPSSSTEQ